LVFLVACGACQSTKAVLKLLSDIHGRVENQRILVKPYFQAFDKSNSSQVSRSGGASGDGGDQEAGAKTAGGTDVVTGSSAL
jgi:hypothetical protein